MLFGTLLLLGVLAFIGVLVDLFINKKDKRPKRFREG